MKQLASREWFQNLLWWPQTPCFVSPGALYLQFCGPHPRILFLSVGGEGRVCYLTQVLSCCDSLLSQPCHTCDWWLTTGLGWTVSCWLRATTTGCQQLVWTEVSTGCRLPQNVRLYPTVSIKVAYCRLWEHFTDRFAKKQDPCRSPLGLQGGEEWRKGRGEWSSTHLQRHSGF